MSISLYIALYYNLLLLLVVYIAIQPVRAETVRQPYINNQIFSLALLLIVYVHVTFRPTDYHYFGDTSAYAMAFQKKAFYGTVAIRTRVRDKDCVKNRVKRAKIVRFTLC